MIKQIITVCVLIVFDLVCVFFIIPRIKKFPKFVDSLYIDYEVDKKTYDRLMIKSINGYCAPGFFISIVMAGIVMGLQAMLGYDKYLRGYAEGACLVLSAICCAVVLISVYVKTFLKHKVQFDYFKDYINIHVAMEMVACELALTCFVLLTSLYETAVLFIMLTNNM